jgi:hypothetical protein
LLIYRWSCCFACSHVVRIPVPGDVVLGMTSSRPDSTYPLGAHAQIDLDLLRTRPFLRSPLTPTHTMVDKKTTHQTTRVVYKPDSQSTEEYIAIINPAEVRRDRLLAYWRDGALMARSLCVVQEVERGRCVRSYACGIGCAELTDTLSQTSPLRLRIHPRHSTNERIAGPSRSSKSSTVRPRPLPPAFILTDRAQPSRSSTRARATPA